MKADIQKMQQLRDDFLTQKRDAIKNGDRQQAQAANSQVKFLNRELRIIKRDY
jgi:hypothetical protein